MKTGKETEAREGGRGGGEREKKGKYELGKVNFMRFRVLFEMLLYL
jgi:hypothetical protein